MIESLQPFHGGDQAHTAPPAVLQWLSNVDSTGSFTWSARTSFDLGSVIVQSETPLEVVEESRHEGPAGDNAVVARLKVKRPIGGCAPLTLVPTFAHTPTLQISDNPIEFRSLASSMDIMRDEVLKVVTYATSTLQLPIPDPRSLELGEKHDAIAAEFGGDVATFREQAGETKALDDEP